ncbi:AI-2E family transporter [Altererythrobacter sp. MF3-039]|uniref:AI-2E family transporter n=1 Tax=Altererythrobacter sp. MF3-039 TaxID=3252901 RepID=UPI00390CBA22
MAEAQNGPGIERGGFLLFLALATAALIFVVWPFAAPLLWAMLAAILFQPLYQRMLTWRGDRENQAALLTLGIIFVAVIVPAFVIGGMVVDQAASVFTALRSGEFDIAGWIEQILAALPASLQAEIEKSGWTDLSQLRERAQDIAETSVALIAQQAVSIGSGALSFLLAFGVWLYVAFFLMRDGGKVGPAILDALPLESSITERLASKFLSIVRATIKGSVVVGIVQGLLGAITFWIVGMPSAMLFGLLMAIASMLPAVGSGLIWVPAAIWLFATGQIWEGIVVVVSGVAVIGMADNILRPILVGRDTGIPDWIILVTTLGGIATLGLSGIVLGPLVAGLFLAAWTILLEHRSEYIHDDTPDVENINV